MDIRKIKKLIEMLQDSDLTEIEVHEGEESVRIARGNIQNIEVNPSPIVSTSPNPPSEKSEVPLAELGSVIKSPIVGTFYRKPAPDKPAFVEVGASIGQGDVVCVIEAMKLFNEIESEVSGKIVKVLVDDSSPVEFDQPLFLVDPS